ncbi:CHLOROPLAST PROTEIN HCF243-RELATED [Salix purpurea]|uniref:CHLOROPLAST PROTEIN HCF243-RELATED n=1 Tax=Salix purpurea TaxID=77065 RepID=A0A9Q0VVX0_SALPP|nr:CHLOROPLAST PROTEIN HCF243-RELATED [Salix purpurea]
MKLSTKPLSSPGRTEKYYPPPLMRFLRSNVGCRSRRRTRSSPMFVRKKSTTIETQEPSSPKVTCMGQVRVRRRRKRKLKSFTHSWPKWAPFFRVGFKRKEKISEDCNSSKTEPKYGVRNEDFEQEEETEPKVDVSTAITPPRNAFLLTRCRSAPYGPSSLAGRVWGSPSESGEKEQKQRSTPKNIENGSPTSRRESASKESDKEASLHPETEVKITFLKQLEGSITSIREGIANSANVEEPNTEVVSTVKPLILRRCKSEPARTGEKLDPETSFWKKRRLGFT